MDDLPQLLQVEPAATLYYIERLRLADGLPVILEKRYVVAQYCPDLTAKDVDGSLYSLWTHRYQLSIEGADEGFGPSITEGEHARLPQLRFPELR